MSASKALLCITVLGLFRISSSGCNELCNKYYSKFKNEAIPNSAHYSVSLPVRLGAFAKGSHKPVRQEQ